MRKSKSALRWMGNLRQGESVEAEGSWGLWWEGQVSLEEADLGLW